MDRGIIFPGQVPLETDLLFAQRASMVGLSKLAGALFGGGTAVNGLAVTQTSVASMNVQVAAGEIYMLANLDANAYSSLPADTAHSIMKQGVILDPVLLALTAPGTAGFSVNYLIQATFSEVDSVPVVLPYYNASNPGIAYSGPANSGATQNTRRTGTVVLTAKAGTAATTGTQTTPAPDSGYVGLAVVTVANGVSTVVSANISVYSAAPLLGATLQPLDNSFKPATTTFANSVGAVVGTIRNGRMNVAAASATATFAADEIVAETALGGAPYRLANFSKSINLATTGAGGMDAGAAPVSGYVALYAIFNPTTGASALLATNANTLQPNVYGGANMPAGYTASALVSVWGTNAGSQLNVGAQADRQVAISRANILSTTSNASAQTAASISSMVPLNAKAVTGDLYYNSATSSDQLLFSVAPLSSAVGQIFFRGTPNANQQQFTVPLFTPQTLYYTNVGATTSPVFVVALAGYTI